MSWSSAFVKPAQSGEQAGHKQLGHLWWRIFIGSKHPTHEKLIADGSSSSLFHFGPTTQGGSFTMMLPAVISRFARRNLPHFSSRLTFKHFRFQHIDSVIKNFAKISRRSPRMVDNALCVLSNRTFDSRASSNELFYSWCRLISLPFHTLRNRISPCLRKKSKPFWSTMLHSESLKMNWKLIFLAREWKFGKFAASGKSKEKKERRISSMNRSEIGRWSPTELFTQKAVFSVEAWEILKTFARQRNSDNLTRYF